MQNYIQSGDVITLVAPYDRTSGQGALVGHIFGVATTTVLSGAAAEFKTTGVFDLTSDTGTGWSVGDQVYWDDSAKDVTKTSSSNTLIGVCAAAKSSGATVGRVRLNGAFTS